MFRVTDHEGDSEEFEHIFALENHLRNTATDEYFMTVMEWAESDYQTPLPMLNGTEIETWEYVG